MFAIAILPVTALLFLFKIWTRYEFWFLYFGIVFGPSIWVIGYVKDAKEVRFLGVVLFALASALYLYISYWLYVLTQF